MFEQRIAKHALNSVLEISKLIPFSLSSKQQQQQKKKKKKKKKQQKNNVSLSSHKSTHFHRPPGSVKKKQRLQCNVLFFF